MRFSCTSIEHLEVTQSIVDPEEALAMDGVVDFVSYRDIPGANNFGPIVQGG